MRGFDRLSRRGFLRGSAAALVGAVIWPLAPAGCKKPAANGSSIGGAAAPADVEAGGGEGFWFYVVSDLHYKNDACRPFFDKVAKQIREAGAAADFGLVPGDVSASGKLPQLQAAKAVLESVGKPFYTVIGNNDYQKPADRSAYERAFPGRLNYTFVYKGWQFIGIDSCDGAKSAATVQPATLQFLDECLAKVPAERPIVLFSHYPMDAGSWAAPSNAADVLRRFKGRKLAAVIAGHTHSFAENTKSVPASLTMGCCSFSKPSGDTPEFAMCHASGGTVKWRMVEVKG